MNFLENKLEFVAILFVMLISLPAHEFAHGLVANFLGDDSAKRAGRLSLNPLKHLNLFGTLALFIFHLGWANPVPVNIGNFKNPKKDMAIVAVAGPICNIILMLFGFIFFRLYMFLYFNFLKEIFSDLMLEFFRTFFVYFILINLNLAIFNLLPIPPLDGSRILTAFLSDRLYFYVMRFEVVGGLITIFLLWLGVLQKPLSQILALSLKIFCTFFNVEL